MKALRKLILMIRPKLCVQILPQGRLGWNTIAHLFCGFLSPEKPHQGPGSERDGLPPFFLQTSFCTDCRQRGEGQGCSGSTGKVAGFTDEGSSRSLMYNEGPSGRGTLKLASPNPTGTGAERLNSWSEPTAAIRKRFEP